MECSMIVPDSRNHFLNFTYSISDLKPANKNMYWLIVWCIAQFGTICTIQKTQKNI